ncbi:MAG: SpoIIE family protein phosphatase [Candidatus Melainabacteria bacterium]|nr:SpoIIE family protein phosphatase [Candidatus Melainabacteria bacterium]
MRVDATDACSLEVRESSQLGEARRSVVKIASDLGFSEANKARLALVCTELGTNLLKHTGNGGQMIVQGLTNENDVGVEIFAVDMGKGMDVKKALTDGYSSTGTMGTGLGAVKRNSEKFDIYSAPGLGSVVQSQIWNAKKLNCDYQGQAGFTVPLAGELMSGDKWSIIKFENTTNCLLIDGLGHGFEACEAATLAVKRFKENLGKPPSVVMKAIHTSLRGGRGAVGALAQIDHEHGKIYFCGLGNISAIVKRETDRKYLTSLNGTLGYEARKFMECVEQWTSDSVLIMHSDGLSTKTFEDLHSVHEQAPPIIAAWLYQKYSKGTDDSSILVCKGN